MADLAPHGKWRVLIVDDDEGMRSLIKDVLERADEFVIVATAVDGLDALTKVQATKPDLVLLDVLMPLMGGLEVLPRIKEISPRSKVALLTVLEPWALDPEPTHEADLVLQKTSVAVTLIDELRSALMSGPQRRSYDERQDS